MSDCPNCNSHEQADAPGWPDFGEDREGFPNPARDALLATQPTASPEQAEAPGEKTVRAPDGWALIKVKRLEAIREACKDPSEQAYEGRGLYDDGVVFANWSKCRDALGTIEGELNWLDADTEDLPAHNIENTSESLKEAVSCFRKAAWERDHAEVLRWQVEIFRLATQPTASKGAAK